MKFPMRTTLSGLMLAVVLLTGCGAESPAPATTSAPTTAPEATPAPTATPEATAPAEASATPEPAAPVAAESVAATPTPAPLSIPEPREGVDYTVIDPPVTFSPSPGKIEVVEVFSYTCIHCASLQARITPWKAALPPDVEFRYAPMAYGQSEPLARAFYAAEAMGEHDRTHEALFKAIAVDRKLKQGTAEELADLYADLGVDREALLSTMASFAINANVARNQKTVTRWGIESTPTLVVNGRYRALVTQDRGHDGLLATVEHLIARERVAAAGTDPAP